MHCSEFCGLDACTDTSLTASLLGREVPAEISDLYSAGALPVGHAAAFVDCCCNPCDPSVAMLLNEYVFVLPFMFGRRW